MPTEVTLNEVPVQHVAAKVVFAGEKITLPQGMEIPTAIQQLQQFMEAQEQQINVRESFKVFPWDGAFALKKCLEKRFGVVNFKGAEQRAEIAPAIFENLPWGTFDLPGLCRLTCSVDEQNGRLCFQIMATTRRKNEMVVRTIFKDIRDYLNGGGSIYQGQAIKLRLQYDNGRVMEMPEPSFINTAAIDVSALMFNEDVQDALEVNLYTPIARVKELSANGIPVKRAVLLAGTYGTGKTMAASGASKIAVKNGVTFIYIKKASELAEAIEFAKMYATPACVIFVEDIDRETSGSRDQEMDNLLNVIDGIDTKNTNIIVVLTTNDVDSIHPAMLRPGRLDAVINITPPDMFTAERILRKYCGDALASHEDVSEAAALLAGQIPAILAECVKRAKLSQLSLNAPGEPVSRLTGAALTLAARSMSGQIKLLADRIEADKPKSKPKIEEALEQVVASAMANGAGEALGNRFGWN